jgi:hypothetical protein
MIVKLEDTNYSSAEEKAEFIIQSIQETLEQCFFVIQDSEKAMLESLINFCNTGKFIGFLDE